MSQVIVTLVTEQQQFPAETVAGGIRVGLAGFPDQVLTAAPFVATFNDVGPGTFEITAQAVDHAGANLGAAITGSVTIEAPAPVEAPAAEPAAAPAQPAKVNFKAGESVMFIPTSKWFVVEKTNPDGTVNIKSTTSGKIFTNIDPTKLKK